MSDGNENDKTDCGCGSGGCCSGGKGGWRGTAGVIVTVAIVVAAGFVIARGLIAGDDASTATPVAASR